MWAYSYVDGDHLVGFILKVREEFLRRGPLERGEESRPNSLSLVAIDLFEGTSTDQQLEVLRNLLADNPGLLLTGSVEENFAHSDTAETYIVDLVCGVVRQVLMRDPGIAREEFRRVALAAAMLEEH